MEKLIKPKSSLLQAQLSVGEQCERKAAVRRVRLERRGNRFYREDGKGDGVRGVALHPTIWLSF